MILTNTYISRTCKYGRICVDVTDTHLLNPNSVYKSRRTVCEDHKFNDPKYNKLASCLCYTVWFPNRIELKAEIGEQGKRADNTCPLAMFYIRLLLYALIMMHVVDTWKERRHPVQGPDFMAHPLYIHTCKSQFMVFCKVNSVMFHNRWKSELLSKFSESPIPTF
jgi:hypothetical protein